MGHRRFGSIAAASGLLHQVTRRLLETVGDVTGSMHLILLRSALLFQIDWAMIRPFHPPLPVGMHRRWRPRGSALAVIRRGDFITSGGSSAMLSVSLSMVSSAPSDCAYLFALGLRYLPSRHQGLHDFFVQKLLPSTFGSGSA